MHRKVSVYLKEAGDNHEITLQKIILLPLLVLCRFPITGDPALHYQECAKPRRHGLPSGFWEEPADESE